MKRYVLNIAILAVAAVFLYSCGGDAEKKSRQEKKTGQNIVETGHLEAVNSKSLVMPRLGRWNSLKIIGMVDHGSIVQAGDSVIQFDPTDIMKYILDRETSLESQEASLEKLKINQANTRSAQESNRLTQLASFEQKKMEMEAVRFESERTQRIKKLEFRQAEINLAKEMRKIELNRKIAALDLKKQEMLIERTKKNIEENYAMLDQLTMRTPISGVFEVVYNWRSRGLVKVGDQIYSGNRIAVVPDLTWMKVKTYINENDFLKIHEGQKVAVRLDAMSDVVFDGEISYIGKLCHQKVGSNLKQKVFDVEVKLLVSDERLKPGMTVSCEFL